MFVLRPFSIRGKRLLFGDKGAFICDICVAVSVEAFSQEFSESLRHSELSNDSELEAAGPKQNENFKFGCNNPSEIGEMLDECIIGQDVVQKTLSYHSKKTGARPLRSPLESLLLGIMYNTPKQQDIAEVIINKAVFLKEIRSMFVKKSAALN